MARLAGPPRYSLIRALIRWCLGVFITWALAVVAVLAVAAVVPAWPRRMELPWSDFDDFVVTRDGQIIVYSSFFHQLLVYSPEGEFEASIPGVQGRDWRRIAIDESDRIYIAMAQRICRTPLDELGQGHLKCNTARQKGVQAWRLAPDGEVQPLLEINPDTQLPAGIVKEGGLLVDWRAPRRRTFISENLIAERSGDRLLVRYLGGSSRRISTAWYLYWAKYPFPAALAWVGIFLFAIAERRILKWV